jgi:CHAD domain-containing protein
MGYRCAVATKLADTQGATVPDLGSTSELGIRLLALLEKMPDDASADNVHKLRTTVRRLEVHLGEAPQRIAYSLKSLRKKAGHVRDIDVHLGLLDSQLFTGPRSASHAAVREELREALNARRKRYVKMLLRVVKDAAPVLEARLSKVIRRAPAHDLAAASVRQTLAEARERYLQWTNSVPEQGAQLHRLRIDIKKLRYSLEPLSAFPDAAAMAGRFKQVQDAIGLWHDWATLLDIAGRELGSPASEPAYAAMEAQTTREFHKARRAAERVRKWFSGAKPAASAPRTAASHIMLRKAG